MRLVKGKGEAGMWSLMQAADRKSEWTAREIALSMDVPVSTVRNYLRRLIVGGFAEAVGARAHRLAWLESSPTYRLRSRRIIAPRLDKDGRELPETQNERFWRVLKMYGDLTASELAENAATDTEGVKPHVARRYLRELASVGVVMRVQGGSRGVEATYRLMKKLGPKPPKIAHGTHVVTDPNADRTLERMAPSLEGPIAVY